MKTLIANALIIPMDREGHFVVGDIGLDGPAIAFVGKKIRHLPPIESSMPKDISPCPPCITATPIWRWG